MPIDWPRKSSVRVQCVPTSTLRDVSGWSAGFVLPVYAVINAAFAGLLIVGWVRFLGPKFTRFPDRLRYYSNIDVPALPAVAAPPTATGTGSSTAGTTAV